MKFNKILLIAAMVAACALSATAQTNNTAGPVQTNLLGGVSVIVDNPTISGGLQQIYDAIGGTNGAVTVGGGRATTGDYNLAFVDYLYNFNQYAGLLLGFDDIAKGMNFSAHNIVFVKGGFNLQAKIAPFKNIGLPNFYLTPFTSILMSSGNGNVGEIVVAGAAFTIPVTATSNLRIGGFYENRSGSGLPTDRVYLCVNVAYSWGF